MTGLSLHGVEVLLLKLGAAEVHAYDNRCPHAGARLSEGRLRGTTLRCSAHHWEFDVQSGEGINPRKCKLARLGVRIDEGVVWVRVRGNERG